MTIHQYAVTSRPSRVEVDLLQLKRNFAIINRDKHATVDIMAVVKDRLLFGAFFGCNTSTESAGDASARTEV